MSVVIFKANFKSSPDNNFIGQQLKIDLNWITCFK